MHIVATKLREALTSKKMWVTIIAAVCAELGMDPDVVWTLMGYVGMQGLVDAAHHLSLPSPKAAEVAQAYRESPSNAELVK